MKLKRLFSAVSGVMLSVSMLYLFQPSISAEAIESTVPDTTQYMLRNAGSGKYLTVANAAAENGSNVIQYEADGIAALQHGMKIRITAWMVCGCPTT